MAYRLKQGNIKAKAIRCIAHEQVARAVSALSPDPVPPTGVHEARKVIKRLRSLLRLLEPSLRPKDFAARYKAIGRLGDQLAGAREAHVMRETVAKLEAHFGASAQPTLAPVKKMFADDVDGHAPDLAAARAKRIIEGFVKEGRKLDKLGIDGKGFGCIAGGLELTYRRGRKAFAMAYDGPEDAPFHELRKAVQWHQRHMTLLSGGWPEHFNVRVAACRELAELLGDDHDLSVLIELVGRRTRDEPGSSGIIALARSRQAELRAAAFTLAQRLFAETPAAFARRMERYWAAAPLISSKPEIQAETRVVTALKPGPDAIAPTPRSRPKGGTSAPRLAVKSPK